MAVILGIESTCDETAAALVRDGREVLCDVIASQVAEHAQYRGVVPEIASRAHIQNILPVLREASESAGVALSQVDAVAVAHRPGLIGSLLIGLTAAKTLAWVLDKPLIAVDHVHAHLYSVMLHGRGGKEKVMPQFPAVGLVCSGGHTALYRLGSFGEVELIGSTIDDAIGEAYDKVAAILGLGYPGGPVIDRLAAEGDEKAVRFPRSYLGRQSLDFSFSGLKTAVLYHVYGVPGKGQAVPRRDPGLMESPGLSDEELRDVAASFQAACIDVVLEKLKRAARRVGAKSVLVGGGVSANRGLRAALTRLGLEVFLPDRAYCTDNAAMTAGLGYAAFAEGRFADLGLDAITYSQFAR